MKSTKRFKKSIVLFFAVAFSVSLWTIVSSTPSLSKELLAKVSPSESGVTKAPLKGTVVPGMASRIVNIRVQDQPNQTVVRMIGNGPFHNYQFRRLAEDRFLLELPGIKSDASRASVPTRSRRVKRIYIDGTAPQGIQLVGTLQVPLSRHSLNKAGNELVLTLYPSHKRIQPFPSQTKKRPAPPVRYAAPSTPSSPQPILADPRSKEISTPLSSTSSEEASEESSSPTISNELEALQAELEQVVSSSSSVDEEKIYEGKLISLDVQDADMKSILRLIADTADVNMVFDPGISGNVNIKVNKIPWDQALDLILEMNGFGTIWTGNIIRIASKATLQQEEKERQDLIKAKQDEIKARQDELKAKQDFIEAAKDFGEIVTEYLYVSYAPASEVATKIGENMSEKGKISVDERTKLVIYSDFPARIQTARELIGRLDKATPQVIIEARVVQVRIDKAKELGFQWAFNYKGASPPVNGVNPAIDGEADFAVNQPLSLAGFDIATLAGQTLWNLDMRISALETSQVGRVLSSPKVVTLDGVAAKISQGTEIPYQTESESGGTTTEFKKANLELLVTPSITPDNRVRMKVDVRKDIPGAVTADGIAIDTRNVTTELLVESGMIVVIGGVIEETETDSEERTPYLSRIPLVGRLFKNTQKVKNRTELLVFISPTIIHQPKHAPSQRAGLRAN